MKSYTNPSPVKLIIHFLKTEKVKVLSLILLSILVGVVPAVDSLLLKNIINTIESFSDDKVEMLSSHLMIWAIIYACWWEGLNIVWRTLDYVYLRTIPLIKGQVLQQFYNYTQYHNHKFFQDNLAGHITNRIVEASRSLEMVFANFNEKILRKLSVICFAWVAMYSVHQVIATIFLIWLSVFIGISVIFSGRINRYSINYAINKATVAGKIVDSISNISAIRMFTSHEYEERYLQERIDTTIQSEQAMQWFMFKLRYVLGSSCSVMIFLMLYYIIDLREALAISIGDCVLVLSLCTAVADDIWDLTQEIGDMFEDMGAFNQSTSLIQPYIITDVENAKELQVTNGIIEFRNVTFKYWENNNLFDNKTVTIKSKQKVGLVGFSGSGKSTFVSLITRLYDIESGEILIDGQDISKVTQDSLRGQISIIPQEPILFHRTIMENIRYGKKDATEEEVIEAAKLAHIHDVIDDLPEKYNTLCGERGNNLSGGQRQRVVIARAILKNAPILILDEATSSLDSRTEGLIQGSLEYLMKNKTVLVIAHRLSTLLNMDRILVFSQGSILEDGKHEELLESGKLYKKLWKSQVKGFISDSPKNNKTIDE
jgi:ABC-type multidrug transport system fused ATPase/permease subunit